MRLFNFSSKRNLSLLQSSVLSSLLSIMVVTFLFFVAGLFPTLILNADLASPFFDVATRTDHNTNSKPVGDYRKDLKSFVKRTKNKEDSNQRIGAIVDLCLLHDQLVTDARFETNQQLQGFRAIAGDRLKKCRREIELEILRANRTAEKIARTEKTKDRTKRETNEHSIPVVNKTNELTDAQLEQWLIQDMQTITQISGGPIRCWGYTGGNYAGPLCDHGPDLVRLIETTINPDFWRSNGGSGVIYYYQPLRILVVSASSKVHGEMTDLLRTIRANGR